MNITIKKAALNEKERIKNLMQFYFYDFSEYVEAHLEENGKFGAYPYLDDYWTDPARYPYLVDMDGKLAGFALVRLIEENDQRYFSIAEFFVMKKYRRTGLGKVLANEVFNLHQGQWEVFQMENNIPAQHFWRKVISDYTNGEYREHIKDKRVIQTFISK
ncbi:GNAT family N-acetyltransferase [Anaerobacillus isosaccharinicus]|uniref:GNAT family N-acetyltransferase n=1 Tax=Anaerobacillus isosaccharinicus TaxID=1532552 RepID=A0A1S2M2W3_9BACI|nr:GNAT family N-acetyltransferase [Anaerobacillus isosaccharinicus]MBA5588213.1 GNAT family N-acetyltransferase [Anaerobacillus isosaccharinicus]QOY38339.1 GNAT family N-acetyltransferase [Anaerobacillus isosaccharinicus]